MKSPYATEVKLVRLRETPLPSELAMCDTPESIAKYVRTAIYTSPMHNPEVESMWVLYMNTRRRVTGHAIISTGTLDTILVHPREVFKGAIVANASAIVLTHNHPSGDPTPSEADVKVTRDLIRAGELLRITVLDHVIMGVADEYNHSKGFCSLRELGYFKY